MGIPRFYSEYIRSKTPAVKNRYEGTVNSLSIDLNGLIHEVAQKTFGYGAYNNEELRRMNANTNIDVLYSRTGNALTNRIGELVRRYKPEMLVLAVDGVAPLGKINQQRKRRYIAAIDRDPSLIFDSNAISPGTDFMIFIDQEIRRYITQNRKQLPAKIIYSSHLVPGEGEHKIAALMRDGTTYTQQGIHLLHGADADLNMISLLLPLPNIWIIREDNRGDSYIDIEALKDHVKKTLATPTAAEDFVVITCLLGNDFLPHIVSLDEVQETLEQVIVMYKSLSGSLVVDGRLNINMWSKLLAMLATAEPTNMSRIAEKPIKHPHPAIEAAKEVTQIGTGTTTTVNYDLFRQWWYNMYLSPVNTTTLDMPEMNDEENMEVVVDAIQAYTSTIEWVYLYYAKGVDAINLDWYYPYNFAPLLTDMSAIITTDYDIGVNHLREGDPVHEFYHPLYQMLMILPPASGSILPYNLGNFQSSSSELADLYPVEVFITQAGYNTDWQKDVFLPPLDPQRVIEAFDVDDIADVAQRYPVTEPLISVEERPKQTQQRTYTSKLPSISRPSASTTQPTPSVATSASRTAPLKFQPLVKRQ